MPGWLPKRNVVVPLDFSESSIAALHTALSLVDEPAHVHVVHVLPDLSAMEPGVLWGEITDESRTAHVVAAIRDRLKNDHDCEGVTIAVRVGKPSKEITRHAGEIGADLIVISSHGEGIVSAILGSTTERVVHLAPCPVLVLKS